MTNQQKLIQLVQNRIDGDIHGYLDHPSKKEIQKSKNNKQEDKKLKETEEEYKEALAYIKDIISPSFMKIFPNKIQINNTFAKTFFVYAYPNFLE